MNRKNDVNVILKAAREQYDDIRKGYDTALQDQSLDLRVPIKNLMENLRSALDYMAHDIYETCCQAAQVAAGKPNPRNIYFPYGRTEADFKSGVGSSLPGLSISAPVVYDLIVSVQPFRCSDDWLYSLCSILNEKKHDKLQAQVRSEVETHTVENEFGSVTIPVNNANIGISSMPGAVKIFGVPAEITKEGIRTAPSDRISHKRTKWVAFLFDGTDINVIGLLDRAVAGVTELAVQIYKRI
jgi:hypothetical protein